MEQSEININTKLEEELAAFRLKLQEVHLNPNFYGIQEIISVTDPHIYWLLYREVIQFLYDHGEFNIEKVEEHWKYYGIDNMQGLSEQEKLDMIISNGVAHESLHGTEILGDSYATDLRYTMGISYSESDEFREFFVHLAVEYRIPKSTLFDWYLFRLNMTTNPYRNNFGLSDGDENDINDLKRWLFFVILVQPKLWLKIPDVLKIFHYIES